MRERIDGQETPPLKQIGAGFGAKVYLVEFPDGQKLAKKVFAPNLSARWAYRALRLREHPFKAPYAEFVIKGAYELRRIAHRVGKALNCGVEVVETTKLCETELGFYSPFIGGATNYSPKDEQTKSSLNRLEKHFWAIGLPVWSFGGSYFKEARRKDNVLVGSDGKAYLVDYEAGWPYFNRRDLVGFDDIDPLKFQKFLTLGARALKDRLGDKEYLELMKSWEKYQLYRTFWEEQESAPIRKIQAVQDAFNWRSLNERRQTLLASGEITPEEAEKMRLKIISDQKLIERILPHFLAHFGTFIFLRFPFGSITRPVYTAVMRVANEGARLVDKKKRNEIQIHDLKVMFLSGVPFLVPPFNFFAYLTKILGEEPLSYLILDNLSFRLSGKGLVEQAETLGSHKRVASIFRLRQSNNNMIRSIPAKVEKIMAYLLTHEVVGKASSAIIRGIDIERQNTTKLVLSEQLVLETERAIEKKYPEKD